MSYPNSAISNITSCASFFRRFASVSKPRCPLNNLFMFRRGSLQRHDELGHRLLARRFFGAKSGQYLHKPIATVSMFLAILCVANSTQCKNQFSLIGRSSNQATIKLQPVSIMDLGNGIRKMSCPIQSQLDSLWFAHFNCIQTIKIRYNPTQFNAFSIQSNLIQIN